jgi:hypothetical protein
MRRQIQRLKKVKNGNTTQKAEIIYRNEVTKEKARRRIKRKGPGG